MVFVLFDGGADHAVCAGVKVLVACSRFEVVYSASAVF
jgi:hypothetical protein